MMPLYDSRKNMRAEYTYNINSDVSSLRTIEAFAF